MTPNLVPARQLHPLLGVSQVTVNKWQQQGLLTKPMRDPNDGRRKLFDLQTVFEDIKINRLGVSKKLWLKIIGPNYSPQTTKHP